MLGAGGFATVYRCWQLAVGREVAVKVDNRVLLSERDRHRFLREVTAAGRLSGHPHVIDVYDAGTLLDGRPYLVMELCPAGSLNDALRRHGPMPAGQVRDIGVRLADALAAAHAAGVLHRDIKPANILVNRFGMVGLRSARREAARATPVLRPGHAGPAIHASVMSRGSRGGPCGRGNGACGTQAPVDGAGVPRAPGGHPGYGARGPQAPHRAPVYGYGWRL